MTIDEALSLVPDSIVFKSDNIIVSDKEIEIPQEVRKEMATRIMEMIGVNASLKRESDPDLAFLDNIVDDLNPLEWWLIKCADIKI